MPKELILLERLVSWVVSKNNVEKKLNIDNIITRPLKFLDFTNIQNKNIDIGTNDNKYLNPYDEAVVCHSKTIPIDGKKQISEIQNNVNDFLNKKKMISKRDTNKTGLKIAKPNSFVTSRLKK